MRMAFSLSLPPLLLPLLLACAHAPGTGGFPAGSRDGGTPIPADPRAAAKVRTYRSEHFSRTAEAGRETRTTVKTKVTKKRVSPRAYRLCVEFTELETTIRENNQEPLRVSGTAALAGRKIFFTNDCGARTTKQKRGFGAALAAIKKHSRSAFEASVLDESVRALGKYTGFYCEEREGPFTFATIEGKRPGDAWKIEADFPHFPGAEINAKFLGWVDSPPPIGSGANISSGAGASGSATATAERIAELEGSFSGSLPEEDGAEILVDRKIRARVTADLKKTTLMTFTKMVTRPAAPGVAPGVGPGKEKTWEEHSETIRDE